MYKLFSTDTSSAEAYRKLRLTVVVLCALYHAGCGPRTVDPGPPLPDLCPPSEDRVSIQWFEAPVEEGNNELLRWCAAVGPPVIEAPDDVASAGEIDSLAIVTWNTHVGGGSLGYFIRQLRTGVLTGGRRVDHFIILLQETFRDGDEVPVQLSSDALYAGDIFPVRELGIRRDVRQIAREAALHVFYVPSMRNGLDRVPPEDRGNAILSTLPLTDYRAWILPLRHQRRVTVGATVAGETSAGESWRFDIINVHLDNRTGLRTFVHSFSRVRERQTEYLLGQIRGGRAAVLGGDFNTWLGEGDETAVRRIREEFTEPADHPVHGTLKFGAILERQTDFLFFRLPGGWRTRYRRINGTYGSDHYPLLGWVVFGNTEYPEETR